MGRARYVFVTVCVASACSHGSKQRVLSDKVNASACAVDDRLVYVVSNDALSTVDRQTGAVGFLTNDARDVDELVAIDGSLYWNDGDGVHVWSPGATTRTSIASFTLVDRATSLVRLRKQLCWGRSVHDNATVECFDLKEKRTALWWSTPNAVSVSVAEYGDRLYAATTNDDGNTSVLDLTDPAAPTNLFTLPGVFGHFAATPDGPVLTQSNSLDLSGSNKIYVSGEHPILLDVSAIQTIGGRVYGYRSGSKRLVRIDLKAGTETPVAGAHGRVICGDSKALYVTGARGELLQLEPPAHG